MVLPRLIHPINITIEQWSEAQTVFDDDFREPVKQAARLTPVIVKGQPNWDTKDKVVVEDGGTKLESVGYVLFRYVDLASKSLTLKKQDRIKKMGHLVVDLYIIAEKPAGHYPDQNGAALVKAYFTDRTPSRGV